jgi:hypothetical protein
MKAIRNFPGYYITKSRRVWSEHSEEFLEPQINQYNCVFVGMIQNKRVKFRSLNKLYRTHYGYKSK